MAASPKILPSVCPLDCPDTCSLSATVVGDRLTAVRGSRANPYTAGAICTKVSTAYPNVLYGPERLTRPLLRTGARGNGTFTEIDWGEAIDRVHDGLRAAIDRHGPQTVLPLNYAGPHGKLAMEAMDRRCVHKLGATLLDRPPFCGAPGRPGWPQPAIHRLGTGKCPESVARAYRENRSVPGSLPPRQ